MVEIQKKVNITEIQKEISLFLVSINQKYGIEPKQIIDIIKKGVNYRDDILIPSSIFTIKLGIIEAVVKFLREDYGLKIKQISKLLNRNEKTIYAVYNMSRKKYPARLTIKDSELIPLSIFSDRRYGGLQHLCIYLKDKCNLSYKQIAVLLQRNERTIWTSYNKR